MDFFFLFLVLHKELLSPLSSVFLDFTYGSLSAWMFSETGFLGLGQPSAHLGGSYVHTFCFFLFFFRP